MSPLFIYKNKLLVKDAKLASNQNCCCQKCSYIEIVYDWTFGNNVDLDTKTVFNGLSLGYNCFGGNCGAQGPPGCGDQYMTWGGDNVNQSGTETVVVLVKKALDDGIWNNQTTIELNAYWYQPNQGPQGGPTKIFIRLFTDDGVLCKEVCCITDNLPELEGCVNNLVGTINVIAVGDGVDFNIDCNNCVGSCSLGFGTWDPICADNECCDSGNCVPSAGFLPDVADCVCYTLAQMGQPMDGAYATYSECCAENFCPEPPP